MSIRNKAGWRKLVSWISAETLLVNSVTSSPFSSHVILCVCYPSCTYVALLNYSRTERQQANNDSVFFMCRPAFLHPSTAARLSAASGSDCCDAVRCRRWSKADDLLEEGLCFDFCQEKEHAPTLCMCCIFVKSLLWDWFECLAGNPVENPWSFWWDRERYIVFSFSVRLFTVTAISLQAM